ncbi:MAG: TatD family nuclease-associated radical SAM protein [bacterium]|nr:TatD family nuclease-associated radical SAM protein [bacterium]MDD5354505.1 TatD family nuclease-associated radical SAM protein [bacterium]MDD5756279.1 TatD family nuclease-associated radical SAM protein [bacterium]
MTIVYQIGHSLYLNITNRCPNQCGFCVRYKTDSIQGYDLTLAAEPSVKEILEAIGNPARFREIVFCGYGEPLVRLAEVIAVSKFLKGKNIPVRVNTNGQGNLIHQRNIIPEIAPYISTISVSLNAENEDVYNQICQPSFGPGTYQKVKEFILACKPYIANIIVTAVAVPQVNIKTIQQIVEQELGVRFKLRHNDDIVQENSYGHK